MKTLKTIRETFYGSLPLAAVILVCLFLAPMDTAADYLRVLVGYVSVIVGQSLFLVGLDSSILPIGRMVGGSFAKYNKLFFILAFGFVFGLLATVAEPALAVLARQISGILPIVHPMVFIWITAAGIGMCVALALLRIVENISIKTVFTVLYAAVFVLLIFSPEEFVALAFDGSGATTGDVSVPFILALGIGISATFSKYKTNDDSLGIIGIASVGPIVAVLLYGVIVKAAAGTLPEAQEYAVDAAGGLGTVLVGNLQDVALAILPIVCIATPFLLWIIRLPGREYLRLLLGVLPVYLGLLIFLSGIDYGFSFVGQYIGRVFFDPSRPDWFAWLLLIVGFVLGAAITISEPAVTVLGEQIEELTNGHIKNMSIRITLAVGIGVASLLCVLKILTQINILYFLVPMYVLALVLMKFTPTLFVGLAFDSGGVTGGALTSAFLTPLTLSIAQSVAERTGSRVSILTNGFGIISFISVTPLIAVQILGIVYDIKARQLAQEEETLADLECYVSEDMTAPQATPADGEE